MECTRRHGGRSLIEVLVAVAILGLFLGIVLSAIQSTRTAAVRLQSTNNLRQIILGVHQYADQQNGRITGLTKTHLPKKIEAYSEQSLLWLILPYTYRPRTMPTNPSGSEIADYMHPDVPTYKSPGDPTLTEAPGLQGMPAKTSYVLNMPAADGGISLPFSFPDGTGATICASESYYYKAPPDAPYVFYLYTYIFGPTNPDDRGGNRRPTFADAAWFDAVPVTANGQSSCSVPGLTFQVRPAPNAIDPRVVQTPFAAGLPVALFDGSVRTLAPRTAETVFWALITPAGGEVVGDF
jgi:type II secretory pathway pseudopilin PulG